MLLLTPAIMSTTSLRQRRAWHRPGDRRQPQQRTIGELPPEQPFATQSQPLTRHGRRDGVQLGEDVAAPSVSGSNPLCHIPLVGTGVTVPTDAGS